MDRFIARPAQCPLLALLGHQETSAVEVKADERRVLFDFDDVVRRINRQAGVDVLVEVRALIPRVGRRCGVEVGQLAPRS